jgi:putative methionine-R-sulfoxide reductase with GAF domain
MISPHPSGFPGGLPFAALAALGLASFLDRVKGWVGKTDGPHAVVSTGAHPDHFNRLSERSWANTPTLPLNPQVVEFLLMQTQRLKEARALEDLEGMLLPTLNGVCSALGAERATLFLSCSDGLELASYLGIGLENLPAIRIPAHQGIAGAVLRQGTVLVENDLSDNESFYKSLEAMTGFLTLNILAAPLKDPIGNTFGVFQVLNKVGGFTPSDQALILPFVSALADALYPHLSTLRS